MSSKRKALFFDIDGTLLSEITRQVPESAKNALKRARELGHLVFINSGRTWCLIGPIKELVEADGYLCGCGTYLVAGEEVIYSHRIPAKRAEEIKKAIHEFGFDGVLESAEACYFDREESWIPAMNSLRSSVSKSRAAELIDWEGETPEFDKFCLMADENSNKEFFQWLLPDIQVIDRGRGFYECVPSGHSKATAIDRVLEHYHLELEDAYVFGDSTNDLSMFRHAKNAVLMGHHDKELEEYATFLTKTVEDDGIEYAMKELGLID